MSGNLPPGTRDSDIDRAAPGYDEPPFYCKIYEGLGAVLDEYTTPVHCAHFNKPQCGYCQYEDYMASLDDEDE